MSKKTKPENWQELYSFKALVAELNAKWGHTYLEPPCNDVNEDIYNIFNELSNKS